MSRRDLPPGVDAPVFAEPWQAQAFALTLALHEKGLFSWGEWADALSAEVKRPDAAADGSDYYDRWLAALERLLAAKGVAQAPEVDAVAAAWERAAQATPHGKPILLENDPQDNRSARNTTFIVIALMFLLCSKHHYIIMIVLTILGCVDV